MPPAKATMAIVSLLCLSLILTSLPSGAAADKAPTVLLHEGGEQATYEEWDVRWERYDADSASGQDWWCRSMHEAKEGVRAIYCARNGYNSHYVPTSGVPPWNVNITAIPNEDVAPDQSNLVMRYDTNQDSIMRKAIAGASGYQTVTVSFWFWSDTGASDAKQPSTGETVGHDFLNLVYFTGSGDELVKRVAWTDSYGEATAKAWIHKTVNIPNYAKEVGFEFVSGSKAPKGGDATDAFESYGIRVDNGGMKEGVFLDDIDVTGSGTSPNAPLATSVDDLAPAHNTSSVPVGFTTNHPTVPFDYVYLYYRTEGGDWTRYKTPDNPDGRFKSSPIWFNASGDGRYEFYTRGFDVNGDREAMRDSADASTVVDTRAPATEMSLNGTVSAQGSYGGPISFALQATDGGTGVSTTYYKIDGGEWVRYEGGEVSLAGEGAHKVSYYSTDGAGNAEAVREQNLSIASTVAGLAPSAWAIIGGAAAVIAVAGVVIYRRSRK